MDCIHGVEARQMGLLAATGNKNGSRECVKNPTWCRPTYSRTFDKMIRMHRGNSTD